VRFPLYYTERPERPLSVMIRFGNEWFAYGGHKIFVDGALCDRTAAMPRPYNDTGGIGLLRATDEDLYATIHVFFTKSLQLVAHGCALDQILGVLEHVARDQVQRIARLVVFCDIQAYHLISDGRYLPYAIGEDRFKWCTVLASMVTGRCVAANLITLVSHRSARPEQTSLPDHAAKEKDRWNAPPFTRPAEFPIKFIRPLGL
jgi:predicted amidohydrolase YtcJ